ERTRSFEAELVIIDLSECHKMTVNEVNGGNNYENSMAALDRYIAPGLRLWMLIALVSGVLLVMVVLVCCFMRIRIPRTKRQIDLIAARRKMRNQANLPAHPPGNVGFLVSHRSLCAEVK
uniref:Uncharacterized protein n=1 Tax=Parascaris univalens TaxID=6257 RepID=A0A915CDT6_PARUN